MKLIKENVTRLFSDMYFSIPYIKIIHISLLKLLLSKEEIFRYPIEFIREESSSNEKNDKLIIKDFKKVKVVLSKTIKIDLNYLENPKNIKDIFDNKYYLITKDYNNPKIWKLIPLFPALINENINKNRQKLYHSARNSIYLIS